MKIYPFFLAAVAAVMISCSSANTAGDGYESIQGLPVRTSTYSDWSFVNPQGQIILREEFKRGPSAIIGGLFTCCEDGEWYRLCRLNGTTYEVVLDSLAWAGIPSNGLTPIARKNGKIEIVDRNGEPVFYLPNNAIHSASCFVDGMLSYTSAEGYELLQGVVNTQGKTVLAPKYKELEIFGDNLFYVLLNDGSGQKKMIDSTGTIQTQWPDSIEYSYLNDNTVNYVSSPYIIGKKRHASVFNKKGERLLECPDHAFYMKQICGDKFVFTGNRDGVIDLSGKVIKDNMVQILMTSKAIFAYTGNSLERYSLQGDFQGASPDFTGVRDVKGFGYVRYDEYYGTGTVYNADLQILGEKNENRSASPKTWLKKGVYSDFLDLDAIIAAAEKTLENMEKDGWVEGRPLSQTKNAKLGKKGDGEVWWVTPVQTFNKCEMTILTKCTDRLGKWTSEGHKIMMDTPIEYGLLHLLPKAKDYYEHEAKRAICKRIEDAFLTHYQADYTITVDPNAKYGKGYGIENEEKFIYLYNAGEEIKMYLVYKDTK